MATSLSYHSESSSLDQETRIGMEERTNMKHEVEEEFRPWIETPLIESPVLSKLGGCRVFLKMENLQPSRSFKSRGIGNLVLKAVQRATPAQRKRLTFYAPSGGNAGLACAVACASLGQRSIIVVPTTTGASMISRLLDAGASDVITHGANIAEADRHLKTTLLASDEYGVYVPPFDHEDIWDGNESIIHEICAQMGEVPDKVICSVGGGGLFTGICQGLEKILGQRTKAEGDDEPAFGLPTPSSTPPETPSPISINTTPVNNISAVSLGSMSGACSHQRTSLSRASRTSPPRPQVIGVETQGCESFHLSLLQRTLVTLPGIDTLATSLGCVRVTPRALQYALGSHGFDVVSEVLGDQEACKACLRFLEDERVLLEPACGVTLAMVYSGRLRELIRSEYDERGREKKVVLVVCGGSNISLGALMSYKERFGL